MADTTVAEIKDKIKELEKKIQEFFDQVNEAMSWVPDAIAWVIDAVEKGMQHFNKKLEEFWSEINKFLDNFGSITSLKTKADIWETAIAEPIGKVAGDISLNTLRANIEWDGRAAEAYKALAPSQSEGLNGLKSLARQVQSSLDSLANALTVFYVAIGVAIATYIVGMVGAIAACCTGIGAPIGVGEAATLTGVVLGLITSAIAALITFVNIRSTEQTLLNQKIKDVGNQWPKSALGDLSDGSVTDGDGSDWRING